MHLIRFWLLSSVQQLLFYCKGKNIAVIMESLDDSKIVGRFSGAFEKTCRKGLKKNWLLSTMQQLLSFIAKRKTL